MALIIIMALFCLGSLSIRVVNWYLRIVRVRRTMSVVPVLLPSWSLLRAFWPRKYQTYHNDWQFQLRKSYNSFGTNIVALIALFGDDVFFIADANAVVEVSTNPERFPKDSKLYSKFSHYNVSLLTQ